MRILVSLFILLVTIPTSFSQKSDTAGSSKTKQASKKKDFIYNENEVPDYTLPSLFKSFDGIDIQTREQWEAFRRDEILDLLKNDLFGKTIGTPDSITFELYALNPDTLNHLARKKTIKIKVHKNKSYYSFNLWVFLPKNEPGPYPTYLLISHRGEPGVFSNQIIQSGFWPVEQILRRGYATACFMARDLDPDSNEDRGFRNGIHGFLEPEGERPGYAWGTLAAWAWGASRAMDYLETDKEINKRRVAVVGHSRGGKTALWAGASDERFAMAVSNMSGCGGAAISRRRFGETVERINTRFPNWFCKNYHQYNGNETNMPFDQHFLLALMAPRAAYVASAEEDLWADPKGEFMGLKAAEKVYEDLYLLQTIPQNKMPSPNSPVMGAKTGYHIRSGKHNLTPLDWENFMNFSDKLFSY